MNGAAQLVEYFHSIGDSIRLIHENPGRRGLEAEKFEAKPRADRGVGSRVVREVAKKAPLAIEVIDASFTGPRLINILKGRRKIIIIDAIDIGALPGTAFRIRPDEVMSPQVQPEPSLALGRRLVLCGVRISSRHGSQRSNQDLDSTGKFCSG